MQLHFAVMDDEPAFCDVLCNAIKAWAKQENHLVTVSCYYSSTMFLEAWETEAAFDAVFLDIQMNRCEKNGMEVARSIRAGNDKTEIVFITSSTAYLQEGYHVDAVRYLLKPLQRYAITDCLTHICKRLERHSNDLFLFKAKGRLLRIPYQEILYFSSANNYIEIHTAAETLRYLMKLKYIETTLPPQFIRGHRSIILNLERISALVGREAVLQNGERIPMSTPYYKEVQHRFLEYFG